MKIALMWWPPSSGGSKQAIRGNTKAFLENDVDFDLYFNSGSDELLRRSSEYDAIITPHIHSPRLDEYDTHVHLQLGGYPANDDPELLKTNIEFADTISTLDPSFNIQYINETLDITDYPCSVIPNPPNYKLFNKQPLSNSKDYTFVVKLGSSQKPVTGLNMIASHAANIDFIVNLTGRVNSTVNENITGYPPVPFTAMEERYEKAKVILNPSGKDVLPNTAFESFLTGRPYIVSDGAIGVIQSIPKQHIKPEEFGIDARRWMGKYNKYIYQGSHYESFSTIEEAGDKTRDLMNNRDRREEIVNEATEWIESWDGWSWEDKGQAILDVIENNGPIH